MQNNGNESRRHLTDEKKFEIVKVGYETKVRQYLKTMCGIVGFLDHRNIQGEAIMATALRMSETIRHRGPDGAGVWVDEIAGLALGHRRLSILYLPPAWHQPMVSAGRRFVQRIRLSFKTLMTEGNFSAYTA